MVETLCFCSVFMIKFAPEKLFYYLFLLCFHYWGHCHSFLQVYAYLEAHLLKVNRVQIVVEEFLGMAESRREETPSPHVELR